MYKDMNGSILDAPTAEDIAEDAIYESKMVAELNEVESAFVKVANNMLDHGFRKSNMIELVCSLSGECGNSIPLSNDERHMICNDGVIKKRLQELGLDIKTIAALNLLK